jgi:hypothetical protein
MRFLKVIWTQKTPPPPSPCGVANNVVESAYCRTYKHQGRGKAEDSAHRM